jgi:hypothetical protein
LSRRGAENLLALAELGAAIRWLHPSDQAARCEWEPLLLDGLRSLESAGSSTELLEGLRGLFAEVAPTVVIWRRDDASDEGDELDEPACPEPGEVEDEAKAETKPEPEAEPQSRAREGGEHLEVRAADKPKPPARTKRGEPSDRKQAEAAAEAEAATEAEAEAKADADADPNTSAQAEAAAEANTNANADADANAEPKSKTEIDAKPEDDDTEAGEFTEVEVGVDDLDAMSNDLGEPVQDEFKPEGRPPVPEALRSPADDRPIIQWYRRGYADGLPDAPGCARRIELWPGVEAACDAPRKRRRRRADELACSACERGPAALPLAPAAPLELELPRGLAAAVPLALWSDPDQTGPGEDARAFGEDEALEYDLDDRGARLLAVLRTWSFLRRFYPHRTSAPVLPALCAAAEDPSPTALRATLETLLAEFGDGNGEVLVETGRAARRYIPPITLAWVEERVVVIAAPEPIEPGDVITAIDGVSIDLALAEQRRRTPAATASAAIVRTVARLLERDQNAAAIELELLRRTDEGERSLAVQVRADHRADRPLARDLRPAKPLLELDDGAVYVDATRLRKLGAAARRLRKATHVIVDLRGELADPPGSLLAAFLDEPLVVATERLPTGPDARGELPLEDRGELVIEPARPRLHARVSVLADARTRGRAELELLGFERLGATVIGSASAGDLGAVAQAWLPGGWRLRFTHGELRRSDGDRLMGVGVRPTVPVEPTIASVQRGEDALLAAAAQSPAIAPLALTR